MSINKIKDVGAYVLGDIFIKGVPLYLVYFLSQHLSSGELGVIAKYLALFNFFVSVGSFGQTSVCNVYFFKKDLQTIHLSTSIMTALFSFIIIYTLISFISINYSTAAFFASVGWLSTNVLLLYWNSNKEIKSNIFYEGSQSALILLFTLLFFFYVSNDGGSRIVVHSTVMFSFGLLSFYVLFKFQGLRLDYNVTLAAKQLKTGMAVSFCSLANWVIFFGDKFVIEFLYSDSIMGSYFVLQQYLYIYVVGALAVNKSLRPYLYSALESGALKQVFSATVLYVSLILLGSIMSLFLYQEVVLVYFLEESYDVFSFRMAILILVGYFLFSLTFWIHQILIYFDLKRSMYLMYSISLLVFSFISIFMYLFTINIEYFPILTILGFSASCCYGVFISVKVIKERLYRV